MFSQQMGKPKNKETCKEKHTPMQAGLHGYDNPKEGKDAGVGERGVLSTTGTSSIGGGKDGAHGKGEKAILSKTGTTGVC